MQLLTAILDANQDVLSNGASFKRFWSENFASIIDYRPQHMVTSVDAQKRVIGLEIQDDLSYDVANILPPMRAGDIAFQTGLTNVNNKWCGVDFSNFESQKAKDVHILGDAIQGAPLMPKSGHMANAQAKVLAAAERTARAQKEAETLARARAEAKVRAVLEAEAGAKREAETRTGIDDDLDFTKTTK